MERYICIHGHFYQPPRENAWLEYVERQESAFPYHDWNERITAECYLPNASSRILDKDGFIDRVVNNYAAMSFDFGPTLLAWLEKASPDAYRGVIEADRQSRQRFSGHGSAMAQAYNHIIMPLANQRDRYSQVVWGITDFERRFGRKPEGMWLPETATDLETLDIMTEMGIKFIVLAPHQAARVRRIGDRNWKEVGNAGIDPTRAYTLNLPSKRQISIFFYDGPISHAVAFEDILKNGDAFARRLTGAFSEKRNHPQIVSIATDGETYGHHHRFADMALAFALQDIEDNHLAKITNYGEFLEKFPPTHEVEIIEKTSWSCVHGIDRWWSDDGCATGAGSHPDWDQKWRTPLRNAFDFLRDTLADKYEAAAGRLLKDPWDARNGYIDVILDRSPESVRRFFSKYAVKELNEAEKITALKLLELQRHAMLMYTSCGWFFDELSRPEPVQVMQYAGRVVQLAEDLFGEKLEEAFLKILEKAKSNIPEQGNGRRIYEHLVKPSVINLKGVGAHYAVISLLERYSEQAAIYCYSVENEDHRTFDCGDTMLVTGRVKVKSEITGESALISFGVSQTGSHDIKAGVSVDIVEDEYRKMVDEVSQASSATDYYRVIRTLEQYLGGMPYSLRSLFRDEAREVLGDILESAISGINTAYRQLYQHHYPPVRFLSEIGGPIPKVFRSAAELIIDIELRRAISSDDIDTESLKSLLDTAAKWRIEIDTDGIAYDLKLSLEKMMVRLADQSLDTALLKNLLEAVSLARRLPFPIDLWKAQSLFMDMKSTKYPEIKQKAEQKDPQSREWVAGFTALGNSLSIRML